jgi:hypothetical protein
MKEIIWTHNHGCHKIKELVKEPTLNCRFSPFLNKKNNFNFKNPELEGSSNSEN